MKFVVLADSDIVPLVLGICKKLLAICNEIECEI